MEFSFFYKKKKLNKYVEIPGELLGYYHTIGHRVISYSQTPINTYNLDLTSNLLSKKMRK